MGLKEKKLLTNYSITREENSTDERNKFPQKQRVCIAHKAALQKILKKKKKEILKENTLESNWNLQKEISKTKNGKNVNIYQQRYRKLKDTNNRINLNGNCVRRWVY